MSKKRRRLAKILGRFLQIEWGFIQSDVWLLLSHAERTIYMEMRQEWQRITYGNYEHSFSCPYDFLSCSSRTASRAINKFVKFRILEIVEHGGLYRNVSLYRFVSGKWRYYEPDQREQKTLGRLKMKKIARRKINKARRIEQIRKFNIRSEDDGDQLSQVTVQGFTE